jgi:transposase
MGLWRARCLAIGTPGSEVRAGETDRLRGRHRAPARPYVYLLEAQGFEVWLVNARDVKHLGRPKTDRLDAVWLAKVAERQMLRPSFVPPPAIRRLRDLTRYRADLVGVRTAEKQRVEQAAGWTPRSS